MTELPPASKIEELMRLGRQYRVLALKIGDVSMQFFPDAMSAPTEAPDDMDDKAQACGHPQYANVGGMCMECGPGAKKSRSSKQEK